MGNKMSRTNQNKMLNFREDSNPAMKKDQNNKWKRSKAVKNNHIWLFLSLKAMIQKVVKIVKWPTIKKIMKRNVISKSQTKDGIGWS